MKKKSGDKPDACNEPTPQPSAFDSGNGAIGNTNPQVKESVPLFSIIILYWQSMTDITYVLETYASYLYNFSLQINRDLPEELQLLLSNPELDYSHLAEVLSNIQPAQGTSINSSGFDHNTLPALPSMVQSIYSNGFHHNSLSSLLPEHGTSYSDGFNDELETSGQEDAFVNSLWADQGECSGERSMNTLRDDFNPTISLRGGRSIGQSSDADSKIYQQVKKFTPIITIGEVTPVAHKPQLHILYKFISVTSDIIIMLLMLSRSQC